jgi:divalent metal cation (Fe/Co/Zn/Cd) transporter
LILAGTAVVQLIVVFVSHSVALLADTIHNIADAGTAIPLWVAFALARRKATETFTYGYGRVEDFAGIIIVLIILSSALVAGYEAIDRIIHPRPVTQLGWLAAAGVIGFLGNEAVAVFRIRVGRQIDSAALIADGFNEDTTEAGRDALGYYHERKDEQRDVGLGPDHDWSSRAADAFGLMAISYEAPSASRKWQIAYPDYGIV